MYVVHLENRRINGNFAVYMSVQSVRFSSKPRTKSDSMEARGILIIFTELLDVLRFTGFLKHKTVEKRILKIPGRYVRTLMAMLGSQPLKSSLGHLII